MEITYRRTVQVREYESITIEATTTSEDFCEEIGKLEEAVDTEIIEHRDRLRRQIFIQEAADEEDLS
jgi:hypothetical protein